MDYVDYLSEMCIWVPWQNGGENCALFEHPQSLVDKWARDYH